MTKIHHNTLKKAEKLNIDLAATMEGTFVATFKLKGKKITTVDASPTDALALAELRRTLRLEYKDMDIIVSGEFYCVVELNAECEDGQDPVLAEFTSIPTLAALLDEVAATGYEVEECEEESGVIVPLRYRQKYREQGNPNHCGDWIAVQLEGRCIKEETTPKGKTEEAFDPEKFAGICVANDVDMSGKWAALPSSGQKGWQGRYRMNGRQKLELRIAINGELRLPNAEPLPVPQDVLDELRAKHAKQLEKALKIVEQIKGE